jgi:hypothetical protein
MLGLPDGDTDPFMDTLAQDEASRDQQGSDSCNDSGSECEFAQEPPELLAARQQLAAYTARPDEEEPAGGCCAVVCLAQQHGPCCWKRLVHAACSHTMASGSRMAFASRCCAEVQLLVMIARTARLTLAYLVFGVHCSQQTG